MTSELLISVTEDVWQRPPSAPDGARVFQTHLWHLNLPHDELRVGCGGQAAAVLAVPSPHGAATVHRVHAVHIRTYTHANRKVIGGTGITGS